MPRIDFSTWKEGAGASYLGFFFVTVVALGGLGGVWLDRHFHTTPILSVVGVFLGLFAGIREMLKVLKETTAQQGQRPARPGPPTGAAATRRPARTTDQAWTPPPVPEAPDIDTETTGENDDQPVG